MEFVSNEDERLSSPDPSDRSELSPLTVDKTPQNHGKQFLDGGHEQLVENDDEGNEYTTPLTALTLASNLTDASGMSLTDIEHELDSIIAKLNAGEEYDDKRLDVLIALQNEHPEHQARQLAEIREWTESVEDYLAECLVSMRTFIPVNIACSSKSQMQEEYPELPQQVISRIHAKKPLWLVRLDVDDINRLHEVELRDRYNPTGETLDIVELAAVYASYPEEFTSDPTGKKTELKLEVMHLLQKFLKRKDDDDLPPQRLRHPAYGDEDYGPIDDITSTYSTRVVSGISSDEWEGRVPPRRSFQDVCSQHSILSTRIAEIENLDTSPGGSKNFTNVFAQYSGQDLVHAGWLKKETGRIFSVYQSRYVVLTRSDKMLRYFKKEDDTETKGTVDLSLVEEMRPANNNNNTNVALSDGIVAGSECRFQLIDGEGKKWTFEAPTVQERNMWVEHIEYVWMSAPDQSRISISESTSGKFAGRLSFSPSNNK